MPDRSDKFRKLATDCVAIARDVTDPAARATLLTMAQTWNDMASEISKPVMQQQQQQIQPKREK